MNRFWLALVVLMCGCSDDRCNGGKGLHISVELDHNQACLLTTLSIGGTVTIGGTAQALDQFLVSGGYGAANQYEDEYLVPWPTGTTAGEAGAVDFSSSGDAETMGAGHADFVADPTACQAVVVPVHCAFYLPDAGVPDAPVRANPG